MSNTKDLWQMQQPGAAVGNSRKVVVGGGGFCRLLHGFLSCPCEIMLQLLQATEWNY